MSQKHAKRQLLPNLSHAGGLALLLLLLLLPGTGALTVEVFRLCVQLVCCLAAGRLGVCDCAATEEGNEKHQRW